MSRPPKDISGERFNRLTAVRFAEHRISKGKKGSFWEFRCICGTNVVARKQDVVGGKKKSCGCAITDMERGLPIGHAAFNDLFRRYQKSARRRGKPFDLTEDQFRGLTSADCAYCGAPPSLQSGRSPFSKNGKLYRFKGEYTYTGVDRVNNELGYTVSNCLPCCDICNRAKLCMSQREFLEWNIRVYERLSGPNGDGQNMLGKLWMEVRAELRAAHPTLGLGS